MLIILMAIKLFRWLAGVFKVTDDYLKNTGSYPRHEKLCSLEAKTFASKPCPLFWCKEVICLLIQPAVKEIDKKKPFPSTQQPRLSLFLLLINEVNEHLCLLCICSTFPSHLENYKQILLDAEKTTSHSFIDPHRITVGLLKNLEYFCSLKNPSLSR